MFAIFVVFLSGLVHEGAHVLAARLFGLKIRRVLPLPIGFLADIEGLDAISICRKIVIYAAGPLANIGIAIVFISNPYIYYTNMVMAIFNMLPIYPLDGGRIVLGIMSKCMGIMRAVRVVNRFNWMMAAFLILVGMLQLYYYPPNFSILMIGIYLIFISRIIRQDLPLRFFKQLAIDRVKPRKLPTRLICMPKGSGAQELFNRINWDDYHIFLVGGIPYSEDEIISAMTDSVKASRFLKLTAST